MALPSHLETTRLRLYLLNINAKVLILGNGGLKSTRSYEEDSTLSGCVQTLQKIDIQIRECEQRKELIVSGTKLLGKLSFTIDI